MESVFETGYFGEYGGKFVPETLMEALYELQAAFNAALIDQNFMNEYHKMLKEYVGRPSLLYFAEKLTHMTGGAKIYLKREDLNHTGAHKINNTIGQLLLAKSMGKKRIIAETGAGQHGVATATVAALFDMECIIYMGEEDIERQKMNVFRMELLGATVKSVTSGTKTLKDAMNEALQDWVTNVRTTFYCIGSVAGPHPYPVMVREFQKVIGEEAREQFLKLEGKLPQAVVACVGGGSNAMGMFYPFLQDEETMLYGIEAAGKGLDTTQHSATLNKGRVGVLHGAKSYCLQDENGQIMPTHSISAGLDYPGVGPEHAYLKDNGRVKYLSVTDEEALQAFYTLSREEGIIPALESAHAISYGIKIAKTLPQEDAIIINLSGRGDKDVETVSGLERRV